MSTGSTNPKVRETLLELARHEAPCLLNLADTVIGVKTVDRVQEDGPIPVVRITDTNGDPQDIPLRLIESIDLPA
jgi:hypothetical protein